MSHGIRKAAMLLMSLPEDEAALVMSRLKPKQVEAVSIEIARLHYIPAEEQAGVLGEFIKSSPSALGGTGGGLELAKTLVKKALGKDATNTLENVLQQIEALPFGTLKGVDAQSLLTFIVDEQPQTIAVILSHLPAATGAEIIKGLPPERQLAVVRRIATMGQTSPDVLRAVELGLENRMSSTLGQSYEKSDGVASVTEILNVSDRATERTLLENLARLDPELVEEIRRRMFVFDDISKLADKDIQIVLKNVEASKWALALKGASDDFKQKILGNMSQRAAEMLREEMEFLGPVKLSEVEAVQQQIVETVRSLEDKGEIAIKKGQTEEQMVQ